ncbi:hypothetical protein KBD61_04505 [Patescibacteria group bacterium]|nr:hypothetical protein [Patescibacteria group bacterium]MBP9710256.1 hypothetical protein [Patescibacteria group bacterium]
MNPNDHSLTLQIDMEEYRSKEKLRTQRTCRHRFYRTHLCDFDNDKLIDVAECTRCGLQS